MVRRVSHPTHGTVTLGGCRPAGSLAHGALRIHLAGYRCTAPSPLPPPLATADYGPGGEVALRMIDCNDRYGCCTIADLAHGQGVWTGNASVPPCPATWTDAQILAAYAACCPGFDPASGAGDAGCDPTVVMAYACSTGYPDGSKAFGWAVVDGSSQVEAQVALDLGEALSVCLGLPDEWISPFPSADGFTWDVTSEGANPQNGHCFTAVGYDAEGLIVWSWGLRGHLTWAALAAYAVPSAGGGLYVRFSAEQLQAATQRAPGGYDLAQLQADLVALQEETAQS